MNRYETRKLLKTFEKFKDVMEAFANGKKIQVRTKQNPVWTPADYPTFGIKGNLDSLEYQIRPEPECRVLNNEELKQLVGMPVKVKNQNELILVDRYYESAGVGFVRLPFYGNLTAEILAEKCEKPNGKPLTVIDGEDEEEWDEEEECE